MTICTRFWDHRKSVTSGSLKIDRLAWHVARHRDLRGSETELQQLTVDARCTAAVLRHQPDQAPHLRIDSWPTRTVVPLRSLRPVVPERLAVPSFHCIGVNDDEAICQSWPPRPQRRPGGAIHIVERGAGRAGEPSGSNGGSRPKGDVCQAASERPLCRDSGPCACPAR
jgi:hypothetical protein